MSDEGESSKEIPEIATTEYLRGQISGLQQICALLINRLVPLEERGEVKSLLDSRSRPSLEDQKTSIFFKGSSESFIKTSNDLWV